MRRRRRRRRRSRGGGEDYVGVGAGYWWMGRGNRKKIGLGEKVFWLLLVVVLL